MTGSCALCDLPVDGEPVTDPAVEGEFCSPDCLDIARETDICYLGVEGMHCSTCEQFLEDRATEQAGIEAASASYATDTMRVVYDPDRRSEADIPELVSGAGYEAARRSTVDTDSGSTAVSVLIGGGFFGMMTMLWYVLFIYPQHFGFEPVVSFGPYSRLYLLGQLWLFTGVVLFYTGAPILRGAYVSLRAGQPNMDLLVALAATSAYVYSTLVALGGGLDVYFDVTTAIVLVVTAGNAYEERIKRRAVGMLSELTASRVTEGRTRDGRLLPVERVTPGTELLVRPGERVPLDGTVVEGVAAVDESLVTGESLPRTRRPGDTVAGGAVVTDAPLVVEVGDAAASTLDRLVGLLWEIQSSRSGVQRVADRLAGLFVPAVTGIAAAVGVATLALGGGLRVAVLTGLTVLIVSCPCALGLATPLAVAAGVGRAAADGVVVASEDFFERLPAVDIVALDKTGTLTRGSMAVTEIHADGDAERVLDRAAALERFSNHPVADAVVERAAEGDGPDGTNGGAGRVADGGLAVDDDLRTDRGQSVPGRSVSVETNGVAGRVAGVPALVGHPDLFAERGWTVEPAHQERARDISETGAVPVVVGWNGRSRGVLAVADRPRAGWTDTVESLADCGLSLVVLTGDDSGAAEVFADHPDVDEVYTGVPPDGKVEAVERLRDRGPVAMVGDGTNDAPALAAADVGIGIARGAELAIEAADAVVTTGRLDAVPELFTLAGRTRRRVRQNLGWALLYNVVAIPLAATGSLNPLFAALAMTASSTLVVLNSARE
ncbi:MAG: heavy metal translocating P-type ATPase [Salinirussus sp.]